MIVVVEIFGDDFYVCLWLFLIVDCCVGKESVFEEGVVILVYLEVIWNLIVGDVEVGLIV